MSVVFEYTPAAWAAATFNVPPTNTVWAPAVNAPVPEGVLTKVPTVIDPEGTPARVIVPGNVMEYVEVPNPVTANEAAVTVPATAGSVTPPVFVRVPAGIRTTVPATVGLTAILPKFRSTVFEIAIGVITVADVVAVADTCAKELIVIAIIAMVRVKILVVFFIV